MRALILLLGERIGISPAVGAILISASTVIVAVNARTPKGWDEGENCPVGLETGADVEYMTGWNRPEPRFGVGDAFRGPELGSGQAERSNGAMNRLTRGLTARQGVPTDA